MFKYLLLCYASLLVTKTEAADWNQFRGPLADGHYEGAALPTEWGAAKNLVWKVKIPGLGWSSPITWKGKIYLTTAVPMDGANNYSLRAICVDFQTGSIDWNTEIFTEDGKTSPKPHGKNSHASPTPITDGSRLYVHFGHMGTAALNLDGSIFWKKDDLKYKPVHGNGGSPILADNLLIYSIDGADQQCVVARDIKTGVIRWKTDRKSQAPKKFSFSTPLYLKTGGREQIISPASGFVGSYDPKTGVELWRAKYPNDGYSVIPQPVFGHGLVYVSTSYDSAVLLAIKTNGKGNVPTTWSIKKGAPHTPSTLLVGNELYVLADNGLFTCLDATTSEVHYSERLPGGYSSSPIYANGLIYLTNETGTGFVIAAGKEFKQISKNELKERTFATFAAVDGSLIIRSDANLYRFQSR